MARFAFIVPPLSGHVNPTLSVGAALLERGHDVGWISLDASLAAKLPAGGQLLLIRYEQSDSANQASDAYLDAISQKNVYGIDSLKFLYEDVLIPLNRHSYDGIVYWLDAFRPDVVINDHQLFAGAIAAYNRNIRYATSVTAPAAIKVQDELPKIHEWEVAQIVGLQKELGITHNTSIACSDWLTLVFTSTAFFGDMALPGHYRFVGPVIHRRHTSSAFDWNKLHQSPDRPRILVSIGTTFDHDYKRSFFAKVVEALGDRDMLVVVVSEPTLREQWPANFIVQPSVPQLELLPLLDAVVCHAGHNTVCETLFNGLPLVVIPIAYDQSHVAGQVVRSGAGIRLNFNRFRATHLQEAVAEVLTNPVYKAASERIKQSFEAAGGTQKAADLLIGLSQQSQVDTVTETAIITD